MLGTIIWAIVIGAVIGVIARLIVPGRQAMSWWLTIIVGIAAALIGTLIAQAIGVATTPGVDWIELAFQLILAIIGVMLVARMTAGRGRA